MTPEAAGDDTIITLRAMKFDARVGILPQELEVPQPVEVDLLLRVEGRNIVDYRQAYDLVAKILSAGHIPYLEEVAERIAAASLEIPRVRSARVAVRKMRVALPGPLAFAEVAIERARG